ncbi:hypothetical protein [Rickettsia endosymbiont of Polydrusus tereticollis]
MTSKIRATQQCLQSLAMTFGVSIQQRSKAGMTYGTFLELCNNAAQS